MAIRLFNTYSREIEEFAPIEPPLVKMYTCGPTVYNHAHIGNFRAYVFEDLLQRHLEARGFKVHRVMNLTDVDDKTIRNSRAAGLPLAQFTRQFKEAFFEDLRTLRIQPAADFPAATEPRYIERMIAMIEELANHGIAYQAEDGSVYFRLSRFPEYGQLAHLNLDELRPTGRISNDDYEKESIGDFALWKAWDEADGDVGWDSPWGRGRPGWHIECSAMAIALLGPELDIHCGGVDNIFPHHEAEIAQSEMLHGQEIRPLLAPLRAPHGAGAEDGQVRRELLHPARPHGPGLDRARNPLRADLRQLPAAAQFHFRRADRRAQRAGPHR